MRANSQEELIDRLASIQEIQQLAYRYAFAVDSGDRELFESLWIETDHARGGTFVDVHAARGWIGPNLEKPHRSSVLFVGNHLIDFDGADDAHGTVYTLVQIEIDGEFLDQTVIYEDRYGRIDGRWLFRDRNHLLWYGSERSPNPLRQPPANWPERQVGAGIASQRIRRGGAGTAA